MEQWGSTVLRKSSVCLQAPQDPQCWPVHLFVEPLLHFCWRETHSENMDLTIEIICTSQSPSAHRRLHFSTPGVLLLCSTHITVTWCSPRPTLSLFIRPAAPPPLQGRALPPLSYGCMQKDTSLLWVLTCVLQGVVSSH
jgi:hypothetical protein